MGTIIISKNTRGFRFSYNNFKGHPLVIGEVELSIEACHIAIETLKKALDTISIETSKATSGKFFFQLFLDNQRVATSRKFTTLLLMEKGLRDFKENFIKAETLDFTRDVFEELQELDD